MAKQSDKSYREPHIGVKFKAGDRGKFDHILVITGIEGDDIALDNYPTSRDAIKQTIKTKSLKSCIEQNWWEYAYDFNDYLQQIEKL